MGWIRSWVAEIISPSLGSLLAPESVFDSPWSDVEGQEVDVTIVDNLCSGIRYSQSCYSGASSWCAAWLRVAPLRMDGLKKSPRNRPPQSGVATGLALCF